MKMVRICYADNKSMNWNENCEMSLVDKCGRGWNKILGGMRILGQTRSYFMILKGEYKTYCKYSSSNGHNELSKIHH